MGVNIGDDLSWTNHADKIAAKVSNTLASLRRFLINCIKEVKEKTYNTVILLTLEYAELVWGPYLNTDKLEQFQRRGARHV